MRYEVQWRGFSRLSLGPIILFGSCSFYGCYSVIYLLECFLDPLSMSPQKALETIGSNLQKQYERWQPRARYKQSLDPTVEEVKKLCTSLRRNAKEERVLFHYNGHGVPKPTSNGEIWVFNRVGY